MTQDIHGDVYRLPGSQVVYPFDPADAHPVSSMIEEADGNLLGAGQYGVTNSNEAFAGGSLFEIERYSSADRPFQGDFNNDGFPDYVLYNQSTRQTAFWYMNISRIGSSPGPTLPPGWKLVGSGDFDKNGKSDYVLFNSGNHRTAIWFSGDEHLCEECLRSNNSCWLRVGWRGRNEVMVLPTSSFTTRRQTNRNLVSNEHDTRGK